VLTLGEVVGLAEKRVGEGDEDLGHGGNIAIGYTMAIHWGRASAVNAARARRQSARPPTPIADF
jgi:hypothetical protein